MSDNSLLEKLETFYIRFREIGQLITDPEVIQDMNRFVKLNKEYRDLEQIVEAGDELKRAVSSYDEAQEILNTETDKELKEMAEMEIEELDAKIPELESKVKMLLVPADPEDSKNVILEIRAGTGGDEASLFAGDLFRMYTKFCESKRWKIEITNYSEGTSGGYKEIVANITGDGVYGIMKYESGVHRVQRVPATETQGRVHTSAATVAVLPEAQEFDVEINDWIKTPDIQHFHTLDPFYFLKMQDPKAACIVYCHFLPDTLDGSINIPAPFMKTFQSYVISFYKAADRLVVVNPIFIDELVQYGIEREKIYYIPNYVSKDKFYKKSNEERVAIRAKYGLKEDDFVVLGAGQVQTRKGVLDFVDVAKKSPDVQFVWAGGFSFGRITDGYEELKKIQENHPDNVHFIGIIPREEMIDIYNMSDVLFMPSYNELFPMTILEAVNIHIPLVLRDLDLYKNILFDHYMKDISNDGFAQCIKTLKEDSSVYETYAKESEKISEFYSKENVLSMWIDFYLDAYKEKQDKLLKKKSK